jgi:hypothetical protein
MSEPERFSEGRDPIARRLFEAARDERAPHGAQQRALAALGVAGAATAATSAASGQTALGVALAKWFGGGALVGLAVAGGATVLEPPAPAAVAPPTAATVAPAAQVALDPVTLSPASDLEPPARPATAPSVRTPRSVPVVSAPAPATARFETPAEDTLAAELALLDRARQALARGEPTTATSLLERHAREFPRGRLAAEAFVMKIDALVRSGRRASARALAQQHLSRHPRSPHAARIKSLVGLP